MSNYEQPEFLVPKKDEDGNYQGEEVVSEEKKLTDVERNRIWKEGIRAKQTFAEKQSDQEKRSAQKELQG